MSKSNVYSKYEYEYTINLGDATYANVCFNDGNGNWDSAGGNNYRFYAGEYKYTNGKLTKLD